MHPLHERVCLNSRVRNLTFVQYWREEYDLCLSWIDCFSCEEDMSSNLGNMISSSERIYTYAYFKFWTLFVITRYENWIKNTSRICIFLFDTRWTFHIWPSKHFLYRVSRFKTIPFPNLNFVFSFQKNIWENVYTCHSWSVDCRFLIEQSVMPSYMLI